MAGRPPEKSGLREIVDALLIAFILAIFVRTWLFQAFKIPTGSMEDNLQVGDQLLVNKFIYGPTLHPAEEALLPIRPIRRGDVVVFKYPADPERDFIKRCLGLPGDRVEIVDKQLIVGDEPLDESGYVQFSDEIVYPPSSFIGNAFYRYRDNLAQVVVPGDEFFCIGDNRDHSDDSRHWGMVPEEMVKGRALLVYWSVEPRSEESAPAAGDARWSRGEAGDSAPGSPELGGASGDGDSLGEGGGDGPPGARRSGEVTARAADPPAATGEESRWLGRSLVESWKRNRWDRVLRLVR